MRNVWSVGIVAIVALGACESKPLLSPPGSGVGRVNANDRISNLYDTSDTAIGSGPEVESGHQFSVWFKTIGGGCIVPDYVAVQGGGASVTVTPYDGNSGGPGLMCPDIRFSVARSVQVVLTTVGLDTVNLRGYVGYGSSAQLVTLQKVIKVIPSPS